MIARHIAKVSKVCRNYRTVISQLKSVNSVLISARVLRNNTHGSKGAISSSRLLTNISLNESLAEQRYPHDGVSKKQVCMLIFPLSLLLPNHKSPGICRFNSLIYLRINFSPTCVASHTTQESIGISNALHIRLKKNTTSVNSTQNSWQ